jgi:hypothetical protein
VVESEQPISSVCAERGVCTLGASICLGEAIELQAKGPGQGVSPFFAVS